MADVKDIEGIAAATGEKLNAAGISTTEALLERGGTKKGREELAATTGLSERLILRWVNCADLFRIRGLGTQYTELLEAAGVDTVRELAQRRADNLHQKMVETNEAKKLVRQVPSQSQIEGWIDQAKGLPAAVSH
jgi:predicted flap endonuclease-1-like 5' DNA nuclease